MARPAKITGEHHCPAHHRPLVCPACSSAKGGKSKSERKVAAARANIARVNEQKRLRSEK